MTKVIVLSTVLGLSALGMACGGDVANNANAKPANNTTTTAPATNVAPATNAAPAANTMKPANTTTAPAANTMKPATTAPAANDHK